MSRITTEHLSREAWVYVRHPLPIRSGIIAESWPQYGLEDRARELGWREVVVVDDDLGSPVRHSSSGYDRLLAAVCRTRSAWCCLSRLRGLRSQTAAKWHTPDRLTGPVAWALARR